MFSRQFIDSIRKEIPELEGLSLKLDELELNISGYEAINALLIQNNVLDQSNKNIAIFHPPDDLLDIFMLVFMGLSAYKYSILENSKLGLGDFKIGELVEYEGKVVIYDGLIKGTSGEEDKITLQYGDPYSFSPTCEEIPIRYLFEITKYRGSKIKPDSILAKESKINVKKALQGILGSQQRLEGLHGYPPFLVSSERPHLTDLLRGFTINGIGFFDMFPSVKCTTENRQRLGTDKFERPFMFYFVSSLSTADDVLQSNPDVKTLFVDARSRPLSNGSLLSSMREQYSLEDIYWLQSYDRIELSDMLEKMGFQIWIWKPDDFKGLDEKLHTSEVGSDTSHYSDIEEEAKKHNNIPCRMASYSDSITELNYPPGVNIETHRTVQSAIRYMFDSSESYGNEDLKIFSIRAASISNRIFQSPVPINELDKAFINSGKKTVREEIQFLKDRIIFMQGSALPGDFREKSNELIENLQTLVSAYADYWGKCENIALEIASNTGIKVGVCVKYPETIPCVKEKLAVYLKNLGVGINQLDYIVTDDAFRNSGTCNRLVWTFKPKTFGLLMLEARAGMNNIVVYPLQKEELDLSFRLNDRKYKKYFDQDYRATILKVPREILADENIIPVNVPIIGEESYSAFDMEDFISRAVSKAMHYYQGGRNDLTDARLVLFTNGKKAFFQKGNKIRIIDPERDSIELLTIENLSEGDDVVFLGDSNRTIFDELVVFYEHKPEMVNLVRLSELWRIALVDYCKEKNLDTEQLKWRLQGYGLKRHVVTLDNWLSGQVICPDEDDYAPLAIISEVTGNENLKSNLEGVKSAAKTIHALRIKIGHYLSRKITQSYVSPDALDDDPILKSKLDEILNNVQQARVMEISEQFIKIPVDLTNKLLSEDVL